jgi:hypothetical protein
VRSVRQPAMGTMLVHLQWRHQGTLNTRCDFSFRSGPEPGRPPLSKNDRKRKLDHLYTNGKLVGRILFGP